MKIVNLQNIKEKPNSRLIKKIFFGKSIKNTNLTLNRMKEKLPASSNGTNLLKLNAI